MNFKTIRKRSEINNIFVNNLVLLFCLTIIQFNLTFYTEVGSMRNQIKTQKEQQIVSPVSSSHPKFVQPMVSKVYYNKNPSQEELIIPMNKISNHIKDKLKSDSIPQLMMEGCQSIQEAASIYYKEYTKLYKENQYLNNQLVDVILERNSLADQFNQIKKLRSVEDSIRRKRRIAKEIQRNFYCPLIKCHKGYGSEGSLTHHVRLKHKEFFANGEFQVYIEQLNDQLIKDGVIVNKEKDIHYNLIDQPPQEKEKPKETIEPTKKGRKPKDSLKIGLTRVKFEEKVRH